jgi:hypothetical protein
MTGPEAQLFVCLARIICIQTKIQTGVAAEADITFSREDGKIKSLSKYDLIQYFLGKMEENMKIMEACRDEIQKNEAKSD